MNEDLLAMSGTLSAAKPFLSRDLQNVLGRFFGRDFKYVGRQEVEPFLTVLQSIKHTYKDRQEVWHLLLQHLHDYLHYKDGFRLPRDKVVKYIQILLHEHADYAECLIANLPTVKVPLIMANGKSDVGMAPVDTTLFSASKRQKSDSSTAFYNFATPAVKAYLAAQGQPPRITRVTPSTSTAVHVPTFTIVTSSSTSSPSQSHPINYSSTAMGNPQKLVASTGSTPTASPSQDHRMHNLMLGQQSKLMKLEYLQEEAKVKHLNQLEQNQLKLAIQRLQLQRKFVEQQRMSQQLDQGGTKHVRVQMCGTNPPVYKVMRAQDVLLDDRMREAVKRVPQQTPLVEKSNAAGVLQSPAKRIIPQQTPLMEKPNAGVIHSPAKRMPQQTPLVEKSNASVVESPVKQAVVEIKQEPVSPPPPVRTTQAPMLNVSVKVEENEPTPMDTSQT